MCPKVSVFLLFVFYYCGMIFYQLLNSPSLRFYTYGMYSLFARSLRSPPADFWAGGASARKSAYFCSLSSTIVTILYQLLSLLDLFLWEDSTARGYIVPISSTICMYIMCCTYALYSWCVLIVCQISKFTSRWFFDGRGACARKSAYFCFSSCTIVLQCCTSS